MHQYGAFFIKHKYSKLFKKQKNPSFETKLGFLRQNLRES